MKKKLGFYFMAIFCFFSLFILSSCSKQNNGKPIVITWGSMQNEYQYSKNIMDTLNQKLQEKGIPVEINIVDMATTINTQEAGLDPIKAQQDFYKELKDNFKKYDILNLPLLGNVYKDCYYEYTNEKLLVPLNKYLETEEGKKLYASYPELYWESLKINDNIYGVSTMKAVPLHYGIVFNKKFVDKYNLDLSTITSDYRTLEPLLKTVFEGERQEGNETFYSLLEHSAYEMPDYTELLLGCLVIDENTGKIENPLENPEYLKTLKILNEFYKKGYLARILEQPEINVKQGNFLASFYEGYSEEQMAQSFQTNFQIEGDEWIGVNLAEAHYQTYPSVTAISAKSKHKDLAFQVIAAINSDPELSNLLTYGIEGENYNLVEGRVVKNKEGKGTPMFLGMNFGNQLLTYPNQEETINKLHELETYFEQVKKSRLAGFHMDMRKLEKEYIAVQGIYSQLNSGRDGISEDLTEDINNMNEKLKEAGLPLLIDEINKQFTEYEKH